MTAKLYQPNKFRRSLQKKTKKPEDDMKAEESIHIVTDSANLFSGAQMVDNRRNMDIKVNLATTLPLIDESRPIKSRLVVASFPERSNRMWRYFEQRRYEIVHKGGDSTVDDELYKQVTKLLATVKDPNRTLVIVTGDGNAHRGHFDFPQIVEQALQDGWKVELVCWKSCLNPLYETLRNDYPRQMRIRYLDEHRDTITFLKPRGGGSMMDHDMPTQKSLSGSNSPITMGYHYPRDSSLNPALVMDDHIPVASSYLREAAVRNAYQTHGWQDAGIYSHMGADWTSVMPQFQENNVAASRQQRMLNAAEFVPYGGIYAGGHLVSRGVKSSDNSTSYSSPPVTQTPNSGTSSPNYKTSAGWPAATRVKMVPSLIKVAYPPPTATQPQPQTQTQPTQEILREDRDASKGLWSSFSGLEMPYDILDKPVPGMIALQDKNGVLNLSSRDQSPASSHSSSPKPLVEKSGRFCPIGNPNSGDENLPAAVVVSNRLEIPRASSPLEVSM